MAATILIIDDSFLFLSLLAFSLLFVRWWQGEQARERTRESRRRRRRRGERKTIDHFSLSIMNRVVVVVLVWRTERKCVILEHDFHVNSSNTFDYVDAQKKVFVIHSSIHVLVVLLHYVVLSWASNNDVINRFYRLIFFSSPFLSRSTIALTHTMTDFKIRRTTGLAIDLDETKQTIGRIAQQQSERCFAFLDQHEKSFEPETFESNDERWILPFESSSLLWTLLVDGLFVPGDRWLVLCHTR